MTDLHPLTRTEAPPCVRTGRSLTQDPAGAATVTRRLMDAYGVLARLPDRSRPAAYRLSTGGQGALEGWKEPPASRQAVPSPAQVAAMDETLGWFAFLRTEQERVRRVVHLRAFVCETTGRAAHDWRTIGRMLGCSPETARQGTCAAST
ncbi:MAG: DUF6362 family protein [Janthinobacterium lividum]